MNPRALSLVTPRRTFMATALAAGASTTLARGRDRDPADAQPSPEAVLARPEAYNPFAYAAVVQQLWAQGRRQQAAFWFYVFQARTRPWALADKQGDDAAALRSALNEELGGVINPWVASDLTAWRTLAERAVAYERRLPLPAERPEQLDAAAWNRLVDKARADYASQLRAVFDSLTPQTFAMKRREGGLTVGPWVQPGPPLLESWR